MLASIFAAKYSFSAVVLVVVTTAVDYQLLLQLQFVAAEVVLVAAVVVVEVVADDFVDVGNMFRSFVVAGVVLVVVISQHCKC